MIVKHSFIPGAVAGFKAGAGQSQVTITPGRQLGCKVGFRGGKSPGTLFVKGRPSDNFDYIQAVGVIAAAEDAAAVRGHSASGNKSSAG